VWIFARQGFVSVVEHRERRRMLLVRGRFAGDVEAVFPEAEGQVVETPDADYRFRAELDRTAVALRLVDLVFELDYPNFKASLPPEALDRREVYSDVWHLMAQHQASAGA